MDSIEDTSYMWVHMVEACPKMLVQLYHGLIRIFSNHTASLEGSLALMEDRVKEQVAGLELGHMFMLFMLFSAAIQIPSTFLSVRSRTNYKNAYFWV
jgi:hypothetical protein